MWTSSHGRAFSEGRAIRESLRPYADTQIFFSNRNLPGALSLLPSS